MEHEAGSVGEVVKATLQGTIKRLEDIIYGTHDPLFGICNESIQARWDYISECSSKGEPVSQKVRGDSGEMADRLLKQCFKSWPKFSGDEVYPVPCPHNGCPMAAYEKQQPWAKTTYGALRRELAKHVIKCYKQILGDGSYIGGGIL